VTTLTEDAAMASPATSGGKRMWANGYNTPAAMGMPGAHRFNNKNREKDVKRE
jgi:hypothetical protein